MPNFNVLLDEELYELISQNHRLAFNAIYERYKSAMLIYAAKRVPLPVAEDLVQDVFMRIWNNRQHIKMEEKFIGYLFKSLRNTIIDQMSKDTNARRYLDSISNFAESFSYERTDAKIREELFIASLYTLLEDFNPAYIEILKLRMQGYKNSEIAEKLKISEKTVRNRYSILLKILKEKIPFLIILLIDQQSHTN